jgi:putative mRNA 3-end processing factor
VVPCDVLITEATFGLPLFKWNSIDEETAAIYSWWQKNRARGKHSLLGCYALGKAQRVLEALGRITDEEVLVHGATAALTDIYRDQGVKMIPTVYVSDTRKIDPGQLVLAPPAALSSSWARKFGAFESGFASGWMRIRGNKRRRGYDRGFVISDHADWPALLQTVAESQAKKVYVTHGYSEELARYLQGEGMDAEPLTTLFEGESDS